MNKFIAYHIQGLYDDMCPTQRDTFVLEMKTFMYQDIV
jgi:hypothetical protein